MFFGGFGCTCLLSSAPVVDVRGLWIRTLDERDTTHYLYHLVLSRLLLLHDPSRSFLSTSRSKSTLANEIWGISRILPGYPQCALLLEPSREFTKRNSAHSKTPTRPDGYVALQGYQNKSVHLCHGATGHMVSLCTVALSC